MDNRLNTRGEGRERFILRMILIMMPLIGRMLEED